MYEIRSKKVFTFEAAHRMMQDNSKEGFIHGHSFKVEVVLQRGLLIEGNERTKDSLSGEGNVIFKHEFDDIDMWINGNWEHSLIINEFDKNLVKACSLLSSVNNAQKVFALPLQPTCENLAVTLEKVVRGMFFEFDIHVVSIEIWETENHSAKVVCL